MADYSSPQQGGWGGMLSQSPFYSYGGSQSFMPTVPMTSPTTGMTGMADALINGYSQYLQAQNQKGQPMQLGSAAPQNNLGSLIAGLFGGGGGANSSVPPTPGALSGIY
jgi:hypothetical protein